MEYVGGTSKGLRFPKHACIVSRYAMKLEHDLLLIVFLVSGGRGRAMVFSYQSIPLGACA